MKLLHVADVRNTGVVIQPSMFWLAASPDGLVLDRSKNQISLLEIKCPYTRRNATSRELVKDENFYVELLDGKHVLKDRPPQWVLLTNTIGNGPLWY